MFRKRVFFGFIFILSAFSVSMVPRAADYYIDPENGSANGDGGKTDPWRTLEEVIEKGLIRTRDWESHPYREGASLKAVHPDAPIRGGDTIWLLGGYHGDADITGAYNETPITIAAAPGEKPRLNRLRLRAVENWVVKGVSISPSYAPEYRKGVIVDIDDHNWRGPSRRVTIEDCDIFSVADASSWKPDDWVEKAANGIQSDGEEIIIRNNRVRNTRFGISVSGDRCLVSSNVVDGFSGDGLRGLGDFGVFEYNVVKNAYDVDANHDDGFQSWSKGLDGVGSGVVKGVVLRGNLIINHENPDHPYRTTLQGIGCFDGMFEDWVIENNVVITDHWHGITLLGAINSRIVNNTVIDLNDRRPGPPWIQIGPHKNKRQSQGNIVRNNLAGSVRLADGPGNVKDHNMSVDDPSRFFINAAEFNLRLRSDSPAIDAGVSESAPELDRDRTARPQGKGMDIGAYEWREEGTR